MVRAESCTAVTALHKEKALENVHSATKAAVYETETAHAPRSTQRGAGGKIRIIANTPGAWTDVCTKWKCIIELYCMLYSATLYKYNYRVQSTLCQVSSLTSEA